METKLTTFKLPAELHKKLKELAAREGTDMTEIIVREITEYIRVHGSNNPADVLDKWQDPDYKQFPAFKERLTTKWIPYLEKCSEKELQEAAEQAEGILNMALKIKRSL